MHIQNCPHLVWFEIGTTARTEPLARTPYYRCRLISLANSWTRVFPMDDLPGDQLEIAGRLSSGWWSVQVNIPVVKRMYINKAERLRCLRSCCLRGSPVDLGDSSRLRCVSCGWLSAASVYENTCVIQIKLCAGIRTQGDKYLAKVDLDSADWGWLFILHHWE